MAFQVSIGDAILLSQIAWRLGQTFTKGRKSAPVEFQEIEDELYSLSAALRAAESERDSVRPSAHDVTAGNNQGAANQDTFEHIIRNCRNTLAHLEDIIKKYMIVSEQADSQKPKLQRWSHLIMKNWRKIEWTTEKGDLNTLRSQIMLHTNSLNLLINIGTSSRAASIEQSLNKKLALLEELYQWYVVNLRDTKSKSSTTSQSFAQACENTSQDGNSTFELSKKLATGDEMICPCATVRNEWTESSLDCTWDRNSSSMFVCKCQSRTLSYQPLVERYGLSHLIFPIRIASDDGSWLLYKTADKAANQLVDLNIRKVHPHYLHHLEDTFFRSLSRRCEEVILARGAGNNLCYITADTREEHILEAMSDLKISQTSVESVTFKSGRTHHIQEWVTDVQILQYGVPHSGIATYNTSTVIRSLDYAEILISFDADEAQERDDVVSMVLKLRRNAVTALTKNASVEIKCIEAVGTYSDERTMPHSGLDVIIQFTTRPAAKEFHEQVESMRKELFVKSLQNPRSSEQVVLNLQTAKVECDSVYIDDAEITIVVDTDSKYRLIITSRNRRTIISQILVEDFFTSLSSRPNFTGSTYLVQIGETGERKVYHYKNGFRYLSLSTTQANRMLELARSSVSLRNTEYGRE
ncbi:hypothetical protein F5Y01DRAFT_248592 [Xylaria sp. FL0043]|nr:hypothetical protein F5Y01DRAFT_248592 [Xylaria sp. FL0043]